MLIRSSGGDDKSRNGIVIHDIVITCDTRYS